MDDLTYDVIISLVGGQVAPIVIPYYQFKCKKGILISTDTTYEDANRIGDYIKKRFNVSMEIIRIEPYSFSKIRSSLNNLRDYNRALVNITPGTKPMSIQLFQWARKKKADTIYISTEEWKIIFIKENDETEMKIDAKIGVEEYLCLHGFKVLKSEKRNVIQPFYSAVSNGEIIYNSFRFQIESVPSLQRRLEELFSENELKPLPSGKLGVSIRIDSTELFKLNELTGGGYWLENFVYNQLLKTEHFDDVRKQIVLEKDGHKNEMDVIIMKNFTAGVISCKVKRKVSKSKISPFNQDLYELKDRGDFLGKYTRMFLITTYPLTNNFKRKALLRGIKAYGIKELRNFDMIIKDIISSMEEKIPST